MAEHITPVDYEGFKQGLRILMKSDTRFKDYDFEASGMSAIVKMLASMASTQAVNNNFTLNESHVATSEILGNVQSLVTAQSGYVPGSVVSSKLFADIVVTPPDPNTAPPTMTLPKTFTSMSLVEGVSYTFVPETSTTVPLVGGKYTFENVRLVEGDRVVSRFVQAGVGVNQFKIPNKSIDISTLEVTIQVSSNDFTTQEFEVFHSAFQLGSDKPLFYLSMDRRGYYLIEFGDGAFSKGLDDRNIVYVAYISSSGSSANGAQTFTATSQVGGFGDITITPLGVSTGGSEAEDIDTVKRHARISYGMDGVAVATVEYGQKLKQLYPSYEVTQWDGSDNTPQLPGFVVLSTFPALTELEKQAGNEWLMKYNVGSILTKIVDPSIFRIYPTVYAVASTTDTNKQQVIKSQIMSVLATVKSELSKFGSEFDTSTVEELILSRIPLLKRVFVDYTVSTPPLPTKNIVQFDFHRQIDISTFNVSISNSQIADSVKNIAGEMVAFKGETQVGTLKSIVNPITGIVELQDLKSLFLTPTDVQFGYALCSPSGVDTIIRVRRGEIMDVILPSSVQVEGE